MKMNLEKFKSDKKFRNTVLCSVIGLILVIAVSVAVPIGVHNSNIKKATISEQAASTEPETITENETEPESETTSAEVTEQKTAEATTVEASKVSPPNTTKSSSSDKSSPAKGKPTQKQSGSKSNTKPKQETGTTSPQNVEITEGSWTQAEIDSLVAEIKAYAQSRGFTINPNLTTKGTSWSNPVHSGEVKEKTKSDLTYQVDFVYNLAVGQVGHFPEGAELNVIAEIDPVWSAAAEEICWAIYVVY